MNYVLDTHTHTIASGHAYNTMTEMMQAAVDKDLELLCITDHAPEMPGGPHLFYFSNSDMIDREYYQKKFGGKTKFLFGSELNILEDGKIDLPTSVLKKLDLTIASMHIPCITSRSAKENTKTYLKVMENPYVTIIGHPDDGRYPVDMKELVKGAKEYGKILEVNNHSLDFRCTRTGAQEIDLEMLRLCMEFQQPITVGSDAHIETEVGAHKFAYDLLKQVHFPEELVLNTSSERFMNFLTKKYYK
jgi:putative hydrolase